MVNSTEVVSPAPLCCFRHSLEARFFCMETDKQERERGREGGGDGRTNRDKNND